MRQQHQLFYQRGDVASSEQQLQNFEFGSAKGRVSHYNVFKSLSCLKRKPERGSLQTMSVTEEILGVRRHGASVVMLMVNFVDTPIIVDARDEYSKAVDSPVRIPGCCQDRASIRLASLCLVRPLLCSVQEIWFKLLSMSYSRITVR